MLQNYKHEITAFLGQRGGGDATTPARVSANNRSVELLRTTSPLNPESLASFSTPLMPEPRQPVTSSRSATTTSGLDHGLQTFANTPCSAGLAATLPPTAQVANDPNFNVRTENPPVPVYPGWAKIPQAIELYQRIKQYAMGNTRNTRFDAGSAVSQAEHFQSIGKNTQFSKYLHVRPQP